VNAGGHFQISVVTAGLAVLAGAGCHQSVPSGALVLTQSPATTAAPLSSDILDSRYPSGSRVVLVETPFAARRVHVLSQGLAAAGDPIVSYDGRRAFFTGKASAAGEWQIYEVSLPDGRPRVLTTATGGAMNPALLPDGSLVFASPVPKIGGTNSPPQPSALYVQSSGGQPRRLTFSSRSVAGPTVLSDGRILFVSAGSPSSDSVAGPALFTINNDGTEITAFAQQHDGGTMIERPRELADGRMVYVLSRRAGHLPDGAAEFVRLARPFQSREPLFPGVTARIRSVQPASHGDLLVGAENSSGGQAALAVFRVNPAATTLGAPLVADPAWKHCEAVEASSHRRPRGRLSNMDPAKPTGRILCLDANFTRDRSEKGRTTHVRVFAEASPGNIRALGEVPVQADGSFMADVPADVPLGFEALDEDGRVLRREPPMMWLRPGENRACLGCHEPPNRSPRNQRPLAVSVPVPCLSLEKAALAQRKAD
jgi:Hydrazine synthase alpha subunit middle domain